MRLGNLFQNMYSFQNSGNPFDRQIVRKKLFADKED